MQTVNAYVDCEYGKITYYKEVILDQEEIDTISILLDKSNDYTNEYGELSNIYKKI